MNNDVLEKGKIKLTLDPNNNQSNSIINQTPTLNTVQSVNNEANADYSAGTIDETMLNDEEKQMVEDFAEQIDISDVNQIVKYGCEAQQNISAFSSSILEKVKTYDMGEVGDSLKELTLALDTTVEPEKRGLKGLLQKAKRGVNSIKLNYEKAETNVDKIEKDLISHQSVLMQDIAMYQEMFELNNQYYKELTMYIIAGKKALDKARNGKLKELKALADSTNKQENVQAYRDFEDLCIRFEKKLSNLEITRVISMQSAPQVRMLQNNDRELLDKLQSSISNTIPLWRNQLVLSLGIEHTRRALEAQDTLADKTNELMVKNSETLKMATIGTAKATERSIADIETLQKCNKNLIDSIQEIVKIHEQGVLDRNKAKEELLKIEEDLKQALLETTKSKR